VKKNLLIPCLLILLSSCVPALKGGSSLTNNTLQIHDIQGCSHTSPFRGKAVANISGIVTWKTDMGFYFQTKGADDKVCSSEGIFVFTNSYPSVLPGDEVSVGGKVEEFTPGSTEDHNLSVTEINSTEIQILSTGNALPAAFMLSGSENYPMPDRVIEDDSFDVFDPLVDGLDYWESLEGMLVEVSQAVVVEPRNSYGEIWVLSEDSLTRNVVSSQGALLRTNVDSNPERILVELPQSYKKSVSLGDHFSSSVIGVIGYDYGNYRVIEINQPQIVKGNLPQSIEIMEPGVDSFRVASYNVENLNRFDEDRMQQIAVQITEDLAAPDIIVLEEVQDDSGTEDDGTTAASKNLTTLIKLIEEAGGQKYFYVDPMISNNESGGIGGGNIRTVILYRTDRGIQLVNSKINWLPSSSYTFNNSRQPLVCEFMYKGQPFFVIGVHLVSNNLDTPLFGDIQPINRPEEAKRIDQAKQISLMVRKIREYGGDILIIVAGDFNDVPDSKTLNQITGNGMFNLAEFVIENERYSIIFEGNAQLFDQILISQGYSSFVQEATLVHLNTYSSKNKQISDHDPILVEIQIK